MSSTNVTPIAKSREQTGEEQDPLPAERAALAAAIEAERDALAAIETANENKKRGHAAVGSLRAELDRAKRLVEAAKERDGRAAAASIRKTASAPQDAGKTVRGARMRVLELEDDIEIGEAACARIEQDCTEAAIAARDALVERLAATNGAIAPLCRTLVDRAREAARDLAVAKGLLLALLNDPARSAPEFSDDALAGMRAREQITAPLAGLRAEAERATTRNSSDEDRAFIETAVAEMQSFLARLATDAAAEPPALMG